MRPPKCSRLVSIRCIPHIHHMHRLSRERSYNDYMCGIRRSYSWGGCFQGRIDSNFQACGRCIQLLPGPISRCLRNPFGKYYNSEPIFNPIGLGRTSTFPLPSSRRRKFEQRERSKEFRTAQIGVVVITPFVRNDMIRLSEEQPQKTPASTGHTNVLTSSRVW